MRSIVVSDRVRVLDRRQLLDDGVLVRHALHAQCQHDREDGRQAFGHGRDRQ